MKVSITVGDEVIASSYNSDIIVDNTPKNAERGTTNTRVRASITVGDEVIAGDEADVSKKEDVATQVESISLPDPVYVESSGEPEPTVEEAPAVVEEEPPIVKEEPPVHEPVVVEQIIPRTEPSPIDVVVSPTSSVTYSQKAEKKDEFPPSQWGTPKEHLVEIDEPSRVKPYYVHPKEYDEDSGEVIIDSPRRAHNPYKNGGFLGND